MKWFLVVFTTLFLLSCQKEHNLGEDYNKLIGTWGNIGGDDSVTLFLKPNGVFEYHRSFERKGKFKIKSFEFLYLDSESYRRCDIIGEKRATTFYVNSSFDSIKIYSSDYSYNHSLNLNSTFKLIKK
ncbi:MAG: hypothetical protein V4638_00740 [Bacteroidota bacterium]